MQTDERTEGLTEERTDPSLNDPSGYQQGFKKRHI